MNIAIIEYLNTHNQTRLVNIMNSKVLKTRLSRI